MNLLWQELQFPYSGRNPSQSLGKSAVRIIYCCRTIKWLLADKSRCVNCVQRSIGCWAEKLLQMERMLHFAPNLTAQHPFYTSCFHKRILDGSSPKSRQPLPRDPWLVRSPKLYKKLINVQLWFYYRRPFLLLLLLLLCPLSEIRKLLSSDK